MYRRMTLIELQDILGKQIEKIVDDKASSIEHKKALENAEYIAKIAKQKHTANTMKRGVMLLIESEALLIE